MAISSARAAAAGALSLKGATPASAAGTGRLPSVAPGTAFAPEGIPGRGGSGSPPSQPPAAPGAPAGSGGTAAPPQAPAAEPSLAKDLATNLQTPAPGIPDTPPTAAGTPATSRAAHGPQAPRARARPTATVATPVADPAIAALAPNAGAQSGTPEPEARPAADDGVAAPSSTAVEASAERTLDALLAMNGGAGAKPAAAPGAAPTPAAGEPDSDGDDGPDGPAWLTRGLEAAPGAGDAVIPAAGSTAAERGAGAAGSQPDGTPGPAPAPSAAAQDASATLGVAAARDADGTAASTAAATIHSPVGSAGWSEEIGAHVVWLAHQGVTDASLRLEPEHLGPVEVKISVHDLSASVWFGASAPETRTALQQALPQLRDLFASQGMTLTDAGVSREAPRDAQPAPRAPAAAAQAAATAPNANAVAVSEPRRGQVDTYA